jgi:phage gpG-like protein
MLQFDFRVANAPEFNRRLAGAIDALKDMRAVGNDVVDHGIRPVLREQFASEGSAGVSGKWADLEVEYAERKYKQYGEQPILQASHRLINSLLTDNADSVKIFEERRIVFGSAVPYAICHQTGFRTRLGQKSTSGKLGESIDIMFGVERKSVEPKAGWAWLREAGKMAFVPARPIFDWTMAQRDVVMKALQRGFVNYLRRLGYAIAGRDVGPGEARRIGLTYLRGW